MFYILNFGIRYAVFTLLVKKGMPTFLGIITITNIHRISRWKSQRQSPIAFWQNAELESQKDINELTEAKNVNMKF